MSVLWDYAPFTEKEEPMKCICETWMLSQRGCECGAYAFEKRQKEQAKSKEEEPKEVIEKEEKEENTEEEKSDDLALGFPYDPSMYDFTYCRVRDLDSRVKYFKGIGLDWVRYAESSPWPDNSTHWIAFQEKGRRAGGTCCSSSTVIIAIPKSKTVKVGAMPYVLP